MVQIIWMTILVILLVTIYILDVDIDETREGRTIIWYTRPVSRERDKIIL